jgi:hypothetical protein
MQSRLLQQGQKVLPLAAGGNSGADIPFDPFDIQ